MKKSTILIVFIISLFMQDSDLAQQGTPIPAGARGAGMGNASVTYQDIYSAFSNQSGLAYLEDISFTLHAERRFAVSDLNSISFAGAMPTNSGTFGLTIQHFGSKDYNEQKIGLAYARKLFDKLAIGVQFDYLSTRIPEYGSKSSFTFELGMQANIIENLRVGLHVFSPVRVKLTEEDVLPTQLSFGVSYLASKKLTINAEMEKDIEYPMNLKAGLEYRIIEPLAIRVGMGTEPTSNSFGIGIYLKKFQIDIASSYHRQLGLTPHFSMVFNLKKGAKVEDVTTK